MSNWFVCFDGNRDYAEQSYFGMTLDEVIEKVTEDLTIFCDGGHADIYDEYDNYVTDVEV